MIRSFAHKRLEKFFLTGSKAGINPQFATKLTLQLARLNTAAEPKMMDVAGYDLHELKGDMAGTWASPLMPTGA